jgi:tape measure domain-containing protein
MADGGAEKIGEAYVEISGKLDQLNANLKQAESQTLAAVNRIEAQATHSLTNVGNILADFVGGAIAGVAAGLGALFSIQTLSKIAELGDKWNDLGGELQAISGDFGNAALKQQAVVDGAMQLHTSVDSLVGTMQRLRTVNDAAGGSFDDLVKRSKELTEITVLSGRNAASAGSYFSSFALSLERGGDASRALIRYVQQVPYAMTALQEATGKTRDELIDAAAKGEITWDVFSKALDRQAGDIQDKYDVVASSVSASMQDIETATFELIGKIAGPGSESLAGALESVAVWIHQTTPDIVQFVNEFSAGLGKVADAAVAVNDALQPMADMINKVNNLAADLGRAVHQWGLSQLQQFGGAVTPDQAQALGWGAPPAAGEPDPAELAQRYRDMVTGTSAGANSPWGMRGPMVKLGPQTVFKKTKAGAGGGGTWPPTPEENPFWSPESWNADWPPQVSSRPGGPGFKDQSQYLKEAYSVRDQYSVEGLLSQMKLVHQAREDEIVTIDQEAHAVEDLQKQISERKIADIERWGTAWEGAAAGAQKFVLEAKTIGQVTSGLMVDGLEAVSKGLGGIASMFIRGQVGAKEWKAAAMDAIASVADEIVRQFVQNAIVAPFVRGIMDYAAGPSAALQSDMTAGTQAGAQFAYARGGIVWGRTSFRSLGKRGVAGEAGPEGVVPLSRMADGTMGVRSSGGDSPGVTINVQNHGADVETQDRQGSSGQREIDVIVRNSVARMGGSGGLDKVMTRYGLKPSLQPRRSA